MLEVKKKQQQEKRKRVEQLNERHRGMVTYNPLMTKDAIDDKAKDIQNYKNKISQEKYFQSPNNNKLNTTNCRNEMNQNANKTTHNNAPHNQQEMPFKN